MPLFKRLLVSLRFGRSNLLPSRAYCGRTVCGDPSASFDFELAHIVARRSADYGVQDGPGVLLVLLKEALKNSLAGEYRH